MKDRQDYIERCKEFNLAFLGSRWHRIQYKRKRNGEKVGCVVVFEMNGRKRIGVSKCSKSDKFDRHIGISKAIESATDLEGSLNRMEVPLSMLPIFEDVARSELVRSLNHDRHHGRSRVV